MSLKVCRVGADDTECGRAFQASAVATGNEQSLCCTVIFYLLVGNSQPNQIQLKLAYEQGVTYIIITSSFVMIVEGVQSYKVTEGHILPCSIGMACCLHSHL